MIGGFEMDFEDKNKNSINSNDSIDKNRESEKIKEFLRGMGAKIDEPKNEKQESTEEKTDESTQIYSDKLGEMIGTNDEEPVVHDEQTKDRQISDIISNNEPTADKSVDGEPVLTDEPTVVENNAENDTAAELKAEAHEADNEPHEPLDDKIMADAQKIVDDIANRVEEESQFDDITEKSRVGSAFEDDSTITYAPESEPLDYSSTSTIGGYDSSSMPHFFTESAEYEEERPLDVSDFYPPNIQDSDDNDMHDGLTDPVIPVTYDDAADNADNNAPEEAATPELSFTNEDAMDEAEPTYDMTDESAFSGDEADNTVIFDKIESDSDKSDLESGATVIFDKVSSDEAPDNNSDKTMVFDKITDEKYDSDDGKTVEFTKVADDELPEIHGKRTKTAVAEKKPNIFIRILKAIFPWKGDKKGEVIRKLVFIVAFITVIAMVWQIASYYLIEPMQNENLTNQLRDNYHSSESTDYAAPTMNPKFFALHQENNDLVGWIKVDDTNIDYPIVQGKTNDDYLRHDFNGEYSRYGTIFMDSGTSIEYSSESKNLVIYGHNMKDDSTMFGQLLHYRDLDFYKKHPTFTMDTLYRDGTWKIFAVITTNAYAAQDSGMLFDFRKLDFTDDNEFNDWINDCKIRSCIETGVDVLPTDTVVTLQTCTYEFTEARFVIMARRTRPGEDKSVDVANARINNDAKYPQAWYDAKGLYNPYANNEYYTSVPTQAVESTAATEPKTEIQSVVNSNGETVTVIIYQTDSRNDNNSGGNSGNRTNAAPARTTKRNQNTTKRNHTGGNTSNPTSAPTQAPTPEPTIAPTEPAPDETDPPTPDPEPTEENVESAE